MLAQEVLGRELALCGKRGDVVKILDPGIRTSAGGKATLSTAGSGFHRQQQDLSEISCATLGADLGWLRLRLCPFSRTWL